MEEAKSAITVCSLGLHLPNKVFLSTGAVMKDAQPCLESRCDSDLECLGWAIVKEGHVRRISGASCSEDAETCSMSTASPDRRWSVPSSAGTDVADSDHEGSSSAAPWHLSPSARRHRRTSHISICSPAWEPARLAGKRLPSGMGERTMQLIAAALQRDRFCAVLEELDIRSLVASMEHFEFDSGEDVVQQGKVGCYFFVAEEGCLQVSVNGSIVNTLAPGKTFGALALLYDCPRSATVTTTEASHIWGVDIPSFSEVLRACGRRHYEDNRRFLDSVRLFDALSPIMKDHICEALIFESFENGEQVVLKGEVAPRIYLVKEGELGVLKGGTVHADGAGHREVISCLKPGDTYGEHEMLYAKPWGSTVLASGRCQLLSISGEKLAAILGAALTSRLLEQTVILNGLRNSRHFFTFTLAQQMAIARAAEVREYAPNAQIKDVLGTCFAFVAHGQVFGWRGNEFGIPETLEHGSWFGTTPNDALTGEEEDFARAVAGPEGCRLALLTHRGVARALRQPGEALTEPEGSAAQGAQGSNTRERSGTAWS